MSGNNQIGYGNWRDGSNDHDLDYDDDDDDYDDDAPSCYKCGDGEDVSYDDWEDCWWCSHCEINLDDDGDIVQHDCNNCDQTAAADCPNGQCGSCCSGCKRHGSDWVPDCNSCGDDDDVTGPDEDDEYYCSHCDHHIDEDGDCVSGCNSCGEDDDYEDYEEPDLSSQYCPECGSSNCEIYVLQQQGGA